VNCAKTAISLFSTGASGCVHCEPVLEAVAKQWPEWEAECVCVPLRQVFYGCVVQHLMPEAVGCLRWEACATTCNGEVPSVLSA